MPWDRPSAEDALQYINQHYTFLDGVFHWKEKVRHQSKREVGDIAGWRFESRERRKCWMQYVCGVALRRSHVAWLAHYKEWPAGPVYHVNHDPLDDRIENLSLQAPPGFGRRPPRKTAQEICND